MRVRVSYRVLKLTFPASALTSSSSRMRPFSSRYSILSSFERIGSSFGGETWGCPDTFGSSGFFSSSPRTSGMGGGTTGGAGGAADEGADMDGTTSGVLY